VPSARPALPGRAAGPGASEGLGAADLETVLSGALLMDVGWGACGAVAQPSFGVLVGRCTAGPGPGRPASRTVTVPAQPGAPSSSGTAVVSGREGQGAA
jgi:hypothetical protein